MKPHNARLAQALFWFVAAIYTASIVTAFRSSRAIGLGVRLPADPPRAWLTEALPWAIACAASFALAWLVTRFQRRAAQLLVPCAIGLVVAAWLALQPVSYSMDILRYLWDGRLLRHGVNPYQYVPADPHLIGLQSWRYWPQMAWKQMPDVYLPLAQLYFGAIAVITNGSITAYKLLLLVNGAVSTWLFYHVLLTRRALAVDADHAEVYANHTAVPGTTRAAVTPIRTAQPVRQTSGVRLNARDVRAFALFALFPPLLMESYGAGHVDVFAIPWLLCAWLWTLQGKAGWMGFAVAMATAVKLYPVVLFAALWDIRRPRAVIKSLAVFVMTLVLLYAPFLLAGRAVFAYYRQVGAIAYDGSLSALLSRLFGPAYTPYSTLVVFLAVCAAWVLVLFTRAGRLPLEQKACLLGLTFMLASPLMHPWYPLSLLPFAIGGGGMATLWLAVSAHWTYDELPQDVFIEYLPTYALYLWVWTRGEKLGPFAIIRRSGEPSR